MFALSLFDRRRLSRRQWLQLGAAGAAAGALGSNVTETRAARTSSSPPKAKSVLVIYASGGQSHIDMWDPKPNAPEEIRGAFKTRSTAVPGLQFTELMPKLAQCANRFSVLRSMSHLDADHGSATYLALTGRYHQRLSSNPDPSPTDYPTIGAILNRHEIKSKFPYRAVHINAPALVPRKPSPGQNGGLLGKTFDPLVIGDVTGTDFALPGLRDADRLNIEHLQQRLELKRLLDSHQQGLQGNSTIGASAAYWDQALELLASPRIRNAFRLSREPAAVRDDYGRHRAGQACLLARRLIEAEAPYVNVIWSHSNRGQDDYPNESCEYGWDTHNDIFSSLRNHLLPRFDHTVARLIRDLDERGLLEQTLVICMGEFGRAPKVAKEPGFKGDQPGRKHWASAYSVMFAGAGVARGGLVGATDRWGSEVATRRYGPWDVAATIFDALGVPADAHYEDPLGRPFATSVGTPINELFH